MKKNSKVYVIVGPTASGKSEAAVDLALKHDGEVISADSVQVYKGLDIASGKITQTEMRGVPHHLLDVAELETKFTAEDFRVLGNKAIVDIISRGKTPVIAGGTGFYVDTLVNNIKYPAVESDIKAKINNLDIRSLNKLATETLPDTIWDSFDNKNPARVRSRLGLWLSHGEIPKPQLLERDLDLEFKWLGLNPNQEILNQRIVSRTDYRLENDMIAEVQNMLDSGISASWLKSVGLEYRLIVEHLEKEISVEKLRTEIINADMKYAKRQMTWFKRNQNIKWIESPEDLLEHTLTLNS